MGYEPRRICINGVYFTAKRAAFIDYFMLTNHAGQAVELAGFNTKYPATVGSNLLAEPLIAQEIQRRLTERAKRCNVTKDYVIKKIRQTVERCSQSRPVLDKKGNPVLIETQDGTIAPAYTFDAAGVLKGCEMLGKLNHLKLFTDKIELEGSMTVKVIRKRFDGTIDSDDEDQDDDTES
jgi:phage terminase small subunit